MAEYSIEQIAAACQGQLYQNSENQVVRHLLTDSRKFSFPRDSAFFAIKGERHDGHNYLGDLFLQNVRNFIVSTMPGDLSAFRGANFILVTDTIRALQQVAAMHRSFYRLPVIGVTGSNGKTILKEWLYQLLQKERMVVRSPKSYNSQTGVPLSVWQIKSHHEIAVFEAGISRPGEMKNLEPVIKPDTGIITNIGDAHQEYFRDKGQKLAEKLLLFSNSDALVYCKDHKLIDQYVKHSGSFTGIRLFTWSASDNADLVIDTVKRKSKNTTIRATYKNRDIAITIPFIDQASIENATHAWALMLLLGYPNEHIAGHMRKLTVVAMRMEQKHGINNCIIINDSYNSDPGSFEIALDFLSRQKGYKKKTVILSDMFQTGKSPGNLYREAGELLTREKTDHLIGIGDNIKHIKEHYPGQADFYSSTDEFITQFNPADFFNEAVLLKGSREFGFERISLLLEEKAHATVMEINLDNLVRNYNYFKSLVDQRTRIMAVVKASSYGSGSYEIANVLAYNLIDYLAVAFFDEGVGLRKAGINVPVMVMNPGVDSYSRMAGYKLEPEIYSFSGLKLFIQKMQQAGIKGYPVHIKLDTGMYRLGFSMMELPGLAGVLKNSDSVRVKSLFSHLAASDDPMHDEFTLEQIRQFGIMSDKICAQLDYPILRHILNSAGIERFPGAQYDMVRLGIGLYGVSAIENNRLANVNTFRSIISQIKKVPRGHTIGYARAYRAKEDTRIAIVPVGYADGLDRKLGNGRGKMVVNGKPAPIVGNICMDMCMLDINGILAREGDEVIIFGEENPISYIAESLSTITYEVLTNISSRVKRIYVQE